MSNTSLSSQLCLPPSHIKYLCACGSPKTCFQGSFCLRQLLHWHGTAAHTTLQTLCHPISLGFMWWNVGVVWFGFLGLFGFSIQVEFILFYFIFCQKRSRRNAEKQVKEEELVLKLCLLLLPVYRQFLQGLVLAAAETTHISVDVSCF